MNEKAISIDLQKINDKRGRLTIAEANKNVPFDIGRVYCLTHLNHEPRGFHAHIALQQVVYCLVGSCQFTLDDGKQKETVTLTQDGQALYIPGMCWREMHDFSDDCVLVVLASEHYDEDDYIRDYDQFCERANEVR